jgi:hypothetical protein
MWLVIRDRCWTADRLARNVPHPTSCPHCDQAPENMNHLLLECVFAREFWFNILPRVGLQSLTPSQRQILLRNGGIFVAAAFPISFEKGWFSDRPGCLDAVACGTIVTDVCLMGTLPVSLELCWLVMKVFPGVWLELEDSITSPL